MNDELHVTPRNHETRKQAKHLYYITVQMQKKKGFLMNKNLGQKYIIPIAQKWKSAEKEKYLNPNHGVR